VDVEVAVVVEAAAVADQWAVVEADQWAVVVLDPVVECREAALGPVVECPAAELDLAAECRAVVRGRVACPAAVPDQVVECRIARHRLIRRGAALVRLNCLVADQED
jgi:hypothetical protein